MTKELIIPDFTRRQEAEDLAVDAMCVWEWVLENKSSNKWLLQSFEIDGYVEIRWKMLEIVRAVREVWPKAVEAGYEDCFDWEFVPWFMEKCVDFSTDPWTIDKTKLPPDVSSRRENV